MDLALFTIVCEYEGGTYISQVRAADHEKAMIEWAALLRREHPIGRASEQLAQAVSDTLNGPVALVGLVGAWCWTETVAGSLVLTNIIRSAEPR